MKKYLLIFSFIISANNLVAQERLSPKEFRKKLSVTNEALLLDVRTDKEIQKGYLEGAVFMDFYDSLFKERISAIDRNRPVFVYCAIGGRSWDASKIMAEMGFQYVYDLKGGIIVWKIKNYPFIKLKDDDRQGITKRDFEKMIEARPLTLVDFYAPWCGPCKIMVPALDSIENEMKDSVLIVKINADENLNLMKDYNIKSLPYIMVLNNNKIVFRQEGFMSREEMQAVIRQYYR